MAVVPLLVAAAERSWSEIPAIRLVGLIIGGGLLLAAIRAMFGRRR